MKKIDGKKLGTILTISIIGILIIATLVMAFVPCSYIMNIATPDTIQVFDNGLSNAYNNTGTTDETDIFNNLNDKYENSFEQPSLTALFNGTIGEKAEITAVSERILSTSSGTFLKFLYNEEQTLMNGKTAYLVNDLPIKYTQIVLEIKTENDGFVKANAYVIVLNKTDRYKYYYTVTANYTELVNYIDTLTLA